MTKLAGQTQRITAPTLRRAMAHGMATRHAGKRTLRNRLTSCRHSMQGLAAHVSLAVFASRAPPIAAASSASTSASIESLRRPPPPPSAAPPGATSPPVMCIKPSSPAVMPGRSLPSACALPSGPAAPAVSMRSGEALRSGACCGWPAAGGWRPRRGAACGGGPGAECACGPAEGGALASMRSFIGATMVMNVSVTSRSAASVCAHALLVRRQQRRRAPKPTARSTPALAINAQGGACCGRELQH
jgi:hypothetical protein